MARKTKGPKVCKFPGCTEMAFAGLDTCLAHWPVIALQDRAKRAERRGDAMQTAAYHILGAIAGSEKVVGTIKDEADKMLSEQAQRLRERRAAREAYERQQQQPQHNGSQQIRDAFVRLSLNPAKATSADVEATRKRFARVFHADAGAGGTDQMAEINAAADLARAWLRERGR